MGVAASDGSLVGASVIDEAKVTEQPVLATFLWFDGNVHDAVALYRETFPGLIVLDDGGGSGQSSTISLSGQRIVLFNGGPAFPQTEAASISVTCSTQQEVDRLWQALGVGSGGTPGRCGWLKDRFGVSWQIVPDGLGEILGDSDRDRARKAQAAMMEMTKLDLAALRAAANS